MNGSVLDLDLVKAKTRIHGFFFIVILIINGAGLFWVLC